MPQGIDHFFVLQGIKLGRVVVGLRARGEVIVRRASGPNSMGKESGTQGFRLELDETGRWVLPTGWRRWPRLSPRPAFIFSSQSNHGVY